MPRFEVNIQQFCDTEKATILLVILATWHHVVHHISVSHTAMWLAKTAP